MGFGLALGSIWLLAGAIALGRSTNPAMRAICLSGALLSLLIALVWTVRELLRMVGGALATTRTITAGDPPLQSALLSSIELQRDRAELERSGQYSLALVDAHIERTAAQAVGIDLIRVIPSRWARRAGASLVAVALVHLVALGLLRTDIPRGYKRLIQGEVAAALMSRLDPITGDVEITYLYPAYMGRPVKKLSGTGGEVTAPKGTEVHLQTRSDRPVSEAQIVVETSSPIAPHPDPLPATTAKTFALSVADRRALSGRFVMEEGGSYRFRFLREGKVVAEGPPIPIAVEADEFPQVRITSPGAEIEVDAHARLQIGWSASDDYGLSDLTLVVKPPAGEEQRRPLRTFSASRRDSGSFELDWVSLRLDQGDKLLYWLEVRDNDAISGPKRSASATQVVKIYSEAEHHRVVLEKAQALWEEMVRLLGDRLVGLPAASDRLASGEALDVRARSLQERIRLAAIEIRGDPAAPRELAAALANVAAGIRIAAERVSTARQIYSNQVKSGRGLDPGQSRRLAELDEEMDRELEKDVLYLGTLLDKQRGEDLARLARDFAARRRALASLLEKYRSAPTEQGKKELLAEIARLRRRMQDMLRRMGELAKGIGDQHMNAEALAELSKSNDLMGNLERAEQQLARGNIEAAMKELDALGSALQQMLSSLERTAGRPGQQNTALTQEMLAFKRQLEEIQSQQRELASETEQVKAEYRRQASERLRKAEQELARLQQLAHQAREEVRQAEPGVSIRSEEDYSQSRGRLEDTARALAMRDLEASLDSVRRALPALQRLATGLEDEAAMADRSLQPNGKGAAEIREAQRHAQAALGPARKLQESLERLFPDPRGVLGKGDLAKLDQHAKRQQELERQAAELQQRLQDLMQKAPVFPQSAGQMVGDSRGHMLQAAEALSRKNPQRGHGQQQQALDALGRLQRGLEEMAKRSGGQGGGFPFPFAETGPGADGDEEGLPSREKVEIPGADAYRVPEEFRRDLLEAMKQGTPEPYQGEVQRYYQELVK